ncbi:hypothetical protein AB0H28_11450 [Micromonospora sp. NPDC050980]|uniref:hypothetical protein n=1 Tax=Micromonospora sp. NPDC050980 TaxID=3155161 RepID=UPI0034113E36
MGNWVVSSAGPRRVRPEPPPDRLRGEPAAVLRADRPSLLALVDGAGCHEYFHPDTGAGLGSPAFSWTAALVLDALAEA